ncbi:MAG: helix-turn-helix domain-containing protein, partial [Tannerellaceae bacterium]|nr:helix-turn-helix domain-containing protein [Tannerellaceae bacterium]
MRIKYLRELEKLSKKDFALRIGIDNSQYGKIESGKLTPTIQQLMEISSKFNISTDWLLFGQGEVPEKQENNSINGNNNLVIQGNKNSQIDNRRYYSDSPDVLKAQIDDKDKLLREKDERLREKDAY